MNERKGKMRLLYFEKLVSYPHLPLPGRITCLFYAEVQLSGHHDFVN